MKYAFGDIVVVEGENIGVIVKTWESINRIKGNQKFKDKYYYEVYVRMHNSIIDYTESNIERYMVRHKYLSEEEKEWQNETQRS